MEYNFIPEIRFPEYQNSWSIEKFKDYSTKAGSKNSKGENYEPFSVNNKLGLVSQAEQFEGSRLEDLGKDSYKIVEPNDFAYNPARINVGSIAFNNLEKTVIVSSLYVVLKMRAEIDNEFILQYIKSPIFNYEVRRNTEGSVREYLFYESFKNIKFPLPKNKEEQIKIGEFFSRLDKKILLQEQELDALKQTKQGLLQKMFPKEGETVPEIRFNGFKEEWKDTLLFDTIDKIIDYRGRTPKKLGLSWSESGYLALSALNVKNGYIDRDTNAHYGNYELYKKWMGDYKLRKGQVLFTTEAPMGNVAQVPDDAGYILSQRTIAFETKETKITDDFLSVLISSPIVFDKLSSLASGGTAKGVSQKSLSKLNVSIPTEIIEQEKIGLLFKQLDEIIRLHEKELEVLKETKKAFLQKMFV